MSTTGDVGADGESGTPVYGVPEGRSRTTIPFGSEQRRCEIDRAGTYVGTVVYVRRRHHIGGSTYGWRPEKAAANAALTDKAGAVLRLQGWIW